MHLTPIAWTLASFGMVFGLAFALAIRWDIYLAESGRETISEFLLDLGYRWIVPVILIVACFALTFGGLAGHLWWPKTGRHFIWIIVIVTMLVLFPVGAWIGHRFFGQ